MEFVIFSMYIISMTTYQVAINYLSHIIVIQIFSYL